MPHTFCRHVRQTVIHELRARVSCRITRNLEIDLIHHRIPLRRIPRIPLLLALHRRRSTRARHRRRIRTRRPIDPTLRRRTPTITTAPLELVHRIPPAHDRLVGQLLHVRILVLPQPVHADADLGFAQQLFRGDYAGFEVGEDLEDGGGGGVVADGFVEVGALGVDGFDVEGHCGGGEGVVWCGSEEVGVVRQTGPDCAGMCKAEVVMVRSKLLCALICKSWLP